MNSDSNKPGSPFFSILMPAYNAEAFLDESISSILKQSFSDWELICVDDGSTDNTLKKLQEFQKKDTRIIVKSQDNGGANAARANAALSAKGKYIGYLDADDKFDGGYLHHIHQTATTTGADAIVPDVYMWFNEDDKKSWYWNQRYKIDTEETLTGREAFLRTMPWAIVGIGFWKSGIFKEIPFNTLKTITADEYRTRELFLPCEKVVFSKGIYCYRQHENSTTKSFHINRFTSLLTYKKLEELSYENGFTAHELSRFYKSYFYEIYTKQILFYQHLGDMSESDRAFAKNTLQSSYKNFSDFKLVSFKPGLRGKIAKLLLCRGYALFSFVARLFASVKK